VDHLEVLEGIYEHPDMSGLSATELNSLRNFLPSIGNVVGEAGSVARNTTLTLTNTATDDTLPITAAQDGSFKAAINGAAGEHITIVGADGTDVALTVSN